MRKYPPGEYYPRRTGYNQGYLLKFNESFQLLKYPKRERGLYRFKIDHKQYGVIEVKFSYLDWLRKKTLGVVGKLYRLPLDIEGVHRDKDNVIPYFDRRVAPRLDPRVIHGKVLCLISIIKVPTLENVEISVGGVPSLDEHWEVLCDNEKFVITSPYFLELVQEEK